jgi:AcrR family transcriptional regulator
VPKVDPDERARRIATPTAQRILAAVQRRIIDGGGIHSLTLRAIAADAQLATPSVVTYYFGSKDGVIAAAMDTVWHAHVARLRELLGDVVTVDELVDGLTRALREFMNQPRGMHIASAEFATLALRSPELRARLVRLRTAYRAELAAVLADRQRARVLRLDADPDVVAIVLIAIGRGLNIDAATDPAWDPDAAIVFAGEVIRRVLAV